jgi:hypothetical protein
MNEVIDSFIPWKDISKAYFQSREIAEAAPEPVVEAAPAQALAQAPAPALVEEPEPKSVQFDGDEDDEPPPIALGEDVKLDDDEFETDDESVNLEATETVSLNL